MASEHSCDRCGVSYKAAIEGVLCEPPYGRSHKFNASHPVSAPVVQTGEAERDLAEVVYRTMNARLGEPSQESGTNSKRWDLAFDVTAAVIAAGWLSPTQAATRTQAAAEQALNEAADALVAEFGNDGFPTPWLRAREMGAGS